ncbi:MAG: hypothetical protein NC347_15625 [Clostridium sp.]|nr:hypothetical protein [Clostridium sp.]
MKNQSLTARGMKISIEADNEYVGYCGIKNTAQEQWEIAIEILNKWKQKGIGYKAIRAMMSEILQYTSN